MESLPKGFDDKTWEVHKFGGTSVADASCLEKAASIIEEQLTFSDNAERQVPNLAVVVSAMGGKPKVTDLLLSAVRAAANRDDGQVTEKMNFIMKKHHTCLQNLPLSLSVRQELESVISKDLQDIRDILKTVSLMKWQATRISELVSGYGETWSSQILSALLSARAADYLGGEIEHRFCYLDARRVITIDEDAIKDGAVCWDTSLTKMYVAYQEELKKTFGGGTAMNQRLHFIITGFVASNTHGVATTLQRDGSDYSAAIMGRLLESASIQIWTDVDGVLSADPRRVPDAYVLPEVSFNEAMELAYFGAKVIHPRTMQPCIMGDPQIPIYIRNTFNSSFQGSRIFTSSTTHQDRDRCVCGFASIEKMAIVNVEGSGMVGVKGVARRLFGTLESIGVNVVLIAQASSEHSITFATTMQEAKAGKEAIEEEFHKEISQSRISAIEVIAPCSIIAAVGDGMHFMTGVSGLFFSALGDAKINVLAISQGANERNISAVVTEAESTRALRAVHAAFRLSHTNVRIGIVGMNEIGESLLKILETQRNKLRQSFDIDLSVCAVLRDGKSPHAAVLKDKRKSITFPAYDSILGISKEKTSLLFEESFLDKVQLEAGGLESFGNEVFSENCTNSVIFDCTADEEIGKFHVDWLQKGLNVVTANNTALSGPKAIRHAIKKIDGRKARYFREVTVGGGLPVLGTIRNLLSTGDRIRRIDGILSVTMSYVFHRIAPSPGGQECHDFDKRISPRTFPINSITDKLGGGPYQFSDAIKEAIALGLTEEDPIKDISNEYTARCLMVLAVELGLDEDYSVEKIQSTSESLVGPESKKYSDVEATLDKKIDKRVKEAALKGCVPRHISSIDLKTGQISINVLDVPRDHVFASNPPSCECVRFFTERHTTFPLIVQGPSAGADSTASALLADMLSLMQKKVGPKKGFVLRSTSSVFLN